MVCSICLDDEIVLAFSCQTKKCDYALCEPCVKLALEDSSGASCRACPSCKAPTARLMVESLCGRGAVREVERHLRARVEVEVHRENTKKEHGREKMVTYKERARALYLELADSLNLKCPRCGLVFHDYSGCNALHCGNPDCNASFCAICQKDCGSDAHPHAHTHGNLYDKTLFIQAKTERESRVVDSFLSQHANEPFEVKELVRIQCERLLSVSSKERKQSADVFLNKAKASLRDAVRNDRLSVLSEQDGIPRRLEAHHISPRNAIPDDYKLCLIAISGFKCRIQLQHLISNEWTTVDLPEEEDDEEKKANRVVIDALINIRRSLLCCSVAFLGSPHLYQTSPADSSKDERSGRDEILVQFAKCRRTGDIQERGLSLQQIGCSGTQILGFNQNQRMLLLEKHVEASTKEALLFEPLLQYVCVAKPARLLRELNVPPPETFEDLNSRQQLVAHPLSIKTAMECAGPPGTGKTKVITELMRAILYCTDYDIIILSERNGAIDAIAEKIANDCIKQPLSKSPSVKDFVLWRRVLSFGSAGMGSYSRMFRLEEKLK